MKTVTQILKNLKDVSHENLKDLTFVEDDTESPTQTIVPENGNKNVDLKEKNLTHNYMASSKSPKGKELNPVATADNVFTSNKSEDFDSEHKSNEKDPLRNGDKTSITKQENLNNSKNNNFCLFSMCFSCLYPIS